MYINL